MSAADTLVWNPAAPRPSRWPGLVDKTISQRFAKRMNLFFVCAHDHKLVNEPIEVVEPLEFLREAGPAVQFAVAALKEGMTLCKYLGLKPAGAIVDAIDEAMTIKMGDEDYEDEEESGDGDGLIGEELLHEMLTNTAAHMDRGGASKAIEAALRSEDPQLFEGLVAKSAKHADEVRELTAKSYE